MLAYIDTFMEDDIMERYYSADEDSIQIPMIAIDTGEFCSGIEFENFEKFTKPVKPKRFVTVAGKYIYEDE